MADISNVNDNSLVVGTPSDDSIYNSGSNVTINAYAGNDTIWNNGGNNVTINGGAGADSFRNEGGGNEVSIDGGEGDDIIESYSENDTLAGGAGDDSIYTGWAHGTVFVYGGGNDTINGFRLTNNFLVIEGHSWSTLRTDYDTFQVNVLDGENTVGSILLENSNSPNAELKIVSSLKDVQPYNLIIHDNFSVDAGKDNASLVGTSGKDYITNFGWKGVTIRAGAGNDIIENNHGYNHLEGQAPENAYIDAEAGNDDISNSGTNSTILGGDGTDTISNNGDNVSINGNTGDDYIYNSGLYASINGGDNNDTVDNYGSRVTINGGAGNDNLSNGGSNSSIDGGDGNDLIFSHAGSSNVTINAGTGDDTVRNHSANTFIEAGSGDDYIYMHEHMDWNDETETWDYVSSPDNVTINGGDGNDSIINNTYGYRAGASVSINGGDGSDYISNSSGSNLTINGGASSDSIWNDGDNNSINGGASNNVLILEGGSGTTVNVSEGNDTIIIASYLSSSITSFNVEDFGIGDVIQLASAPEELTTIDGGIVADNVTIMGISAIATGGTGWTTSTNSITYRSGQTAGASLDGNTIVYSTVSSSSDEFTITGLSSTVGVSISGSQVILDSTALDGKSGTVAISGGSYVLSLASDVDTPSSTSGGWNDVGSDGRAVYGAGTTAGWSLSSDGRSVTYASESSADSVLVLEGIAAGTSLADISEDGQVVLWADNFGANGVTVASNPNNYRFNLNGDFEGNSFTGTSDADSINSNYSSNLTINASAGDDTIINGDEWGGGDNLSIDGGEGNDFIYNNDGDNVTIDSGAGNDTIDAYGASSIIFGGGDNDSIHFGGYNATIDGGDGDDTIESVLNNKSSINGGAGNDYISAVDFTGMTINGGYGNDTIYSSNSYNVNGDAIIINGGANNDLVILNRGSGATVNVSEGNDTINLGASVTDLMVEGFNVGDVIVLSETPEELTTIDGGIVAGSVTIMGISAATGGTGWTTSTNSITYHSGTTPGASLDGGTITYSTITSGGDEFTITSLSSTVGVSVNGLQAILSASALDGKSGTIAISGGSYVLSLASDVDTPESTASGWNDVGSDGRAVYGAGTTAGWSLSSDGRSVTYASESSADSVLVLEGIAAGTSLADISEDGQVVLWADNFGANGVTVASNPNNYRFNLSGDFEGNSFTGTDNADTITNYGDNISIDAGAGNDSISNAAPSGYAISAENSTLNGGEGNDTIFSYQSRNVSISGGTGDDFLFNDDGGTNVTMSGGTGNDQLNNDADNVTIDGGAGADNIINQAAEVSINGGNDNDTIFNSDDNTTINGGAGDDSIYLYIGTAAIVNVSEGNDTISVGSSTNDFVVAGFSVGDIIQLATSPEEFTTIDGGIVADGVTIMGISAATGGEPSWTTSTNSITYRSGQTAGASLDGNTITYSTVSSPSDEFTITGLSSTVGVSVDGSQVLLDSTALDGKSGTISISGDSSYFLSLASNVETPSITSGGWNNVGSDGRAVYGGSGITAGWSLAEDSRSVTFAEGNADSLLVLDGVAVGTSLADISSDTVYLTADNFGSNGVTVTSNPNDYSFNLSGDFEDNSFTGTDNADTIRNYGINLSINAGAGDDSIDNHASNSTILGGDGDDTMDNYGSHQTSVFIDGGAGNDSIDSHASNSTILGGDGDDTIWNPVGTSDDEAEYSILLGGTGKDSIDNHGKFVSINGGAGNDSIINRYTGTNTSILGGDGDDYIINEGGSYATILGGASSDIIINFAIYSGSAIISYPDNALIDGGEGDDEIWNGDYSNRGGNNATLLGGAGDDFVRNEGNNSYLFGGAGNDYMLTGDYYVSGVTADGGEGNDILLINSQNSSMYGGAGNDSIITESYMSSVDNATLDGGDGDDYIDKGNNESHVTMNGGAGNDTIRNVGGADISINGGAGNDSINLVSGSGATVNVSEGDNTINLGASVTDFVVEGFGVGDVILISETPDEITTIDGGIVAGNVTIRGISAATGGTGWTTSTDRITYQSGQTAGASLDGGTITYSTVSSPSDEFTITGLSSTLGVSVDSSQAVLGASALYGKRGTVSISGGSYVLSLNSDVDVPVSTSGGWNSIGSDGTAIYSGSGTTEGWALAQDSKSVTFTEGNADTLLALAGLRSGTSLTDISSGTVYLTAENFGASGVTVTSNPNGYVFNLSGNFNGNSFTGTAGDDTITNEASNIRIDGVAGNDSINLVSGTGATVNVGTGNNTINLGASIADLMVDGFGVGDVIVLSETPDELTAIDGGIVAGNVTIGGISAVAQDGFDWTTDYNSITYSNVLTAGATLDGNTITYSTETLSGNEFTITGLSSTVGVSVDGLQVILGAAALSGVTGTVSISGGSYALALASDVAIPVSIAGTWDEVGSDGVAIYRGDGTSEGWALADDSKSVTFAEGGADSILVLEGVAPGTSLTSISDGTVYLTAENFGASGVTVTSNPNGYSFNLDGDFNGNSFTGTEGADSINSNGYNILINGVAGDDSINSNGENATVAGGEGNDAINITGNNNSLDGGAGDDYVSLQSGLAVIISYTEGQGNDTVYGYSESVELQINAESGWESVTSGNDVIINVNEGSSITLVDAAGIEPEEEPEIINEELPGRVVFASWGYGFTPREDSPLYGSPALSEVSAEDSSAGVNMSDGDEWNSSTESEYIVTPTNE